METALKIVGGLALTAGLLFIIPLIGVAAGAFSGWVVGLFYDDTLARLTKWFGLGGVEPWQLGAMLGFVGSFLRSSTTTKSKDQ